MSSRCQSGMNGRLKNSKTQRQEKRRNRREKHAQAQNERREKQVAKARNVDDIDDTQTADENANHAGKAEMGRIIVRDLIQSLQKPQNEEAQEIILRQLAENLNSDTATAIDVVILGELVVRLMRFLDGKESLQCASIKVLVKLASGREKQRLVIFRLGAVKKIYELVTSAKVEVQIEAVAAIGSLVAKGEEIRRYVLQQDILKTLTELEEAGDETLKVAIAQCLAMLSKGGLPIDSPALALAAKLLKSTEKSVLEHACTALGNLTTNGQPETLDVLSELGILKRAQELIVHESETIAYYSLTIVCARLKLHDFKALQILKQILQGLLQVIESRPMIVRKIACRALMNVTSGGERFIQEVLAAWVFPSLVCVLDSRDARLLHDATMLRDATHAIRNVTHHGSAAQIQALVQMGCVPSLCALLTIPRDLECSDRVAELAFDALKKIVASEKQHGQAHSVESVKKCGMQMIKELPLPDEKKKQTKIFKILGHFFNVEREMLLFKIQAISFPEDPEQDL